MTLTNKYLQHALVKYCKTLTAGVLMGHENIIPREITDSKIFASLLIIVE